ncbi:hypothetical protein [Aliiroseovarius crassostreae]|uniref:hypothetical protein n=1 Tax=Aliiroseovarius crassostreae TaxID=154981 RepID=UPI003C7E033A
MPQSASYYPDLCLVHLRVWGPVRLAFLAARMAEWMYEFNVPEGYHCLTDLRQLSALDQARSGMQELVTMQARVYQDVAAPDRSAILANTPMGILAARLFEQHAEGVLQEKLRVVRDEKAALRFLGFAAGGLDVLLQGHPNARHLE